MIGNHQFSTLATIASLILLSPGCSSQDDGNNYSVKDRIRDDLVSNESYLVREALQEVEAGQLREFLPLVREIALTGTPAERFVATGIMRKFGDREGLRVFLHTALNDGNQNIRVRAYKALGELGDFTIFTQIVSGLESSDRGSRLGAIHVLGRLRMIEGIGALLEFWKESEDYSTEVGIVRSLSSITGLDFGAERAAWVVWWFGPGKFSRVSQ